MDSFGRAMLHGKGCDRWFDKSFTLVVCSNGSVSLQFLLSVKFSSCLIARVEGECPLVFEVRYSTITTTRPIKVNNID